KSQVRHIKRHCNYKRDGHKIIITEVYDEPREWVESRGRKRIYQDTLISESDPKLYRELLSHPTYERSEIRRGSNRILKWKCAECLNVIYDTASNRLVGGFYSDGEFKCPHCVLSEGAKKVSQFLIDNGYIFVTEYMFKDLKGKMRSLRFDFALLKSLNRYEEPYLLIEYDGHYHYYSAGDEDAFKMIQKNDRKKNKYCETNKIPF